MVSTTPTTPRCRCRRGPTPSDESTAPASSSTPTAADRRNAIRVRHRPAARVPVVVVTMADGSDDPRQIDDLARLVERGVVVAAASRYMRGGQQVGGRLLKTPDVALRPGSSLLLVRPGRHPRRDQLVQGLRCRLRPRGRHRQPTPASRSASSWWPRPAGCRLPVAEIPTIWLDRTIGQSNFEVATWIPRYLRWYRFAFGPRLTREQLPRPPGTER